MFCLYLKLSEIKLKNDVHVTWLVFILAFEEMHKWNLSLVNIFTLLTLVPHKKTPTTDAVVLQLFHHQQNPMPQDNWWGNLKVEHNVTSCIPFSLILNLKDCCLVFYCTSYVSAEFITIVQASLSNGQSMVQQCNKSFSAHWDYFTFFPFFSCNFFFFSATIAQCQTLSPLSFPARRAPHHPTMRFHSDTEMHN